MTVEKNVLEEPRRPVDVKRVFFVFFVLQTVTMAFLEIIINDYFGYKTGSFSGRDVANMSDVQ